MTGRRRRLEYGAEIGTRIPTSSFEGFTVVRVLARYKYPMLLEMLSPRGESWIFSWLESDEDVDADSDRDRDIVHSWVAFRVSQERLAAIRSDEVSLRDAILAAEHQLYLVTGADPLRPTRARAVPRADLPTGGLPSKGLTIHGKVSTVSLTPPPESHKLRFDFRLEAESISKGELPFGISGIFEDRFQRWISTTAHHAYDPSPRAYELTYKLKDWSNVKEQATAPGSFMISASADGEPHQLDRLDEALTYLQRLVASSSSGGPRETSMELGVGRSGSFALFSLLHFIMATGVSVQLSWGTVSSPSRVKLDPTVADAILNRLQGERRKIESDARLTIPLSPDELAKLRLPVVGEGGLQSLLRALQKQIGSDGRLSVTPAQIERILRYSQSYGSGGFQGRLQGVLVELKRIGASLSSLR